MLANQIKSFLSSLISESQGAFVSGEQIIDYVLIAYELLHYLRRKKQGKTEYMSIKLDISKAYERLEWSYL